jgi:hypothetical protein
MKKKINLTILLCVIAISYLPAQHTLTGVVRLLGQPVGNLTVYTTFAKANLTGTTGVYALDISVCKNCQPGSRIKIYTYHDQYGSGEFDCTIGNDYKFDINISNNPNNIFITGIVQNAVNGDLLEGVEVGIISSNVDMYPVKTNSFGQFRISVNKIQIEKANAVRIQVRDPRNRFKPLQSTPDLLEISAFHIIRMQARNAAKIDISGYINSSICFKEGNVVTIEATGQIRVGTFVGNSDPDGRTSGVMGMSLESYNIVSAYNHAALMYRLNGETEWRLAGRKKKFIAPRNGCLQFQVNDNSQGDNYGTYTVEVSIDAQ